MSKLSEKSLKTLEYYTILDMLAEHCVSRKAKQEAKALRPLHDAEDVRELLTQTDDAKRLMTTGGAPAFGGIREVSAALSRAEMGGVLSTRELLDVASLLHAANQVRKYGAEQQEKGLTTTLDLYFSRINSNKYLEEKINRAIISEEEIADAASTTLANLRRQMRAQNVRVRETLNHFVSSPTYSKYLQESLITQRDGRFVIPVKSEHRGDIPGMVHDVSSSGATLFIEPAQVVDANNQLKILLGKEKAEIERILAELTADVADFSDAIAADYDVLCKLDFIFAKARFSFALNACAPEISETTQVNLLRARHPLLDQKKAVPIDIALGGEYDTLVITGPNTGGKTVSLKTLGLLCLMAASGLHIPANEESSVCLFQNIYADIGDEQSIEQSLSTFSAHMKNIVAIMDKCGPDDLILFDELGAGTDPEEGAALAVAIIEYGRKMCSLVAATTHYSELKVFALTTEGVENASCEFDVRTLQPTYHLLTGVPGKSNAFAISKRLGLPPAIIDRAKEQISAENQRFEDVLETLERERHQLQKQREDADRLRRTAQSEKDKAVTLKGRAEDETDAILEKARDQAERILREARMASETVFAQLDEMKKKAETNAADQNLAAARAALRSTLGQAEKKAMRREKKTVEPDSVRPLKVGDTVHLLNVGVDGVVLKPEDKDGTVYVQAGILKVNVPLNELRLVEKKKPAKPKTTYRAPAGGMREIKRAHAKSELDVRGMTVEEALLEVDRYLSDCLMSHLDLVTIIHGKGTGALRAAIQQHLKHDKHVRSVRNGRYGEGDLGVTVVELK
ncbi:MAG: endonuclease MutS2 [Butyricicoccus porcorum]|nr:endonuclease MutS2 [Butyricicoccus porcorum]MDD6986808.1 endonuclease MutS2 [Butyricicoccus porcorum]